jgi:hypothetical protein
MHVDQRVGPPCSRRYVRTTPGWRPVAAAAVGLWMLVCPVAAQAPGTPPLQPRTAPIVTPAQQEAFLRDARIVGSRRAPGGVTGSRQVTLTEGGVTHDAHVQTVDVSRPQFRSGRETELGFRDSWAYNVAAYRLSVLLGLDMVPVTVERRYQQQSASFTWWVDDVAMDELTRQTRKLPVPDPVAWTRQMAVVRVFDQLIANTDRNLGNLLITSDWQLWMIDHTRAFRRSRTLRADKGLTGCDRRLLERLETLDEATLDRELSRWLQDAEIDALLARRDLIVAFFRQAPPEALFDLPRRRASSRTKAEDVGAVMRPDRRPHAASAPTATSLNLPAILHSLPSIAHWYETCVPRETLANRSWAVKNSSVARLTARCRRQTRRCPVVLAALMAGWRVAGAGSTTRAQSAP